MNFKTLLRLLVSSVGIFFIIGGISGLVTDKGTLSLGESWGILILGILILAKTQSIKRAQRGEDSSMW